MGLKKVIVITPTTGSLELIDAVSSVVNQTYDCHHLLVVDGADFSNKVTQTLQAAGIINYGNKLFRCDLPFNTGGGGYYGHRIMAAFGHLVPHYDYVLFLDQDNWFDPDHVEKLVTACEKNNYDWSYSLRKIYSKNKEYIAHDNCESLGKWPVWGNSSSHHIDTSSYCFKVSFFITVCQLWNFGWGADRRFYTLLKDHLKHTNYSCTGHHTLCYRLDGNKGSVKPEFFIEGNKKTFNLYKGIYPWAARSL